MLKEAIIGAFCGIGILVILFLIVLLGTIAWGFLINILGFRPAIVVLVVLLFAASGALAAVMPNIDIGVR